MVILFPPENITPFSYVLEKKFNRTIHLVKGQESMTNLSSRKYFILL